MKPLGRKIIIIGNSASGKSTLARKLHAKLCLPLYHVDHFTWNRGWKNPASNDDILQHVQNILTQSEFLLEGYLGYTSLPDTRLQAADTVIILDYPRRVLAWRYLKRRFLYHNKNRPEFPEICMESFGWKAFKGVWQYLTARDWRTNLDNWVAQIAPENLLIFKSPLQLKTWLTNFSA